MPAGRAVVDDVDAIGAGRQAETEPASSSVAPLETVAVTPVPIVAEPEVALNRNVLVPPTASELELPSDGAPSISSTPLPSD